MVVLGVDAHKRTHTVVAVDDLGRQLGSRTTTATTSADHLELLRWAERFGPERRWAVEDCRHVSRRLEADLLCAGETIVRVPPRLMVESRDTGRARGKSDPIDALAVARASLRHPDLPTAQLDGPARQVRLLVDHRDDLVAERTRKLNRLRWHLHELDPAWDPAPRSLSSFRHLDAVAARLATFNGSVAEIAVELVADCRALTVRVNTLEKKLAELLEPLVPTLLALRGVGTLCAAKIVGEVADIRRFATRHKFARHNASAPLPASSGNQQRHRLSRSGNRQLNAALYRIALTQARDYPPAVAYLAKRRAAGDTQREALRCLRRRVSDAVYNALTADSARLSTAALT